MKTIILSLLALTMSAIGGALLLLGDWPMGVATLAGGAGFLRYALLAAQQRVYDWTEDEMVRAFTEARYG